MGSHKSKHADLLGVHLAKRLIAKIEQRAKALGCSKSRYAAMILEKWEADGEKPVSAADRALYVLKDAFPIDEAGTKPQFEQTNAPADTLPRATVTKKRKSSTKRRQI